MKQVCVKASTCSCTAATTRGAALPTLTTAMPDPRSISELPSTSTSTPPPARSTNTGSVVLTPADTVAARRAESSRDRGPGISVTSRRCCGGAFRPASRSVTGTPRGRRWCPSILLPVDRGLPLDGSKLKHTTPDYVVSYPELMKQGNNLTVSTHLLDQEGLAYC